MGAFTTGLRFGFENGMLNSMFGGFMNNFCCRNFFMPSFWAQPFNFNFNSLPLYTYSMPNFSLFSRPDIGFQPMFSLPEFNYQLPTPQFTQVQPSFQYSFNIDSSIWNTTPQYPQYQSNFTFGDSFSLTTNKKAKSSSVQKYWYEMSDEEMRRIYGNYTRDITKPYNGTADQLNKYIDKNCGANSVLKGKGAAFIAAQKKYGISASVLLAIAKFESVGGTSDLARNKFNITSISTGKSGDARWKQYSSVEECINDTARLLKENYVENAGKGKHLTKIYEINAKYCPVKETSGNSKWAKNVSENADAIERV